MRIWKEMQDRSKTGSMVLAFIAFIALGMPDGLLGVAWPSVRTSFLVPMDAVGLLLLASMIGYITSSFLSGPLIGRLGVGRVLAASCALTGTALVGYTLVPVWWMVVVLGVAAGLGAGAIDSGLNAYVAAHYGEGVMQGLHASYGIGVTIGPMIMTFALTTLQSWQLGYRAVGGLQLALAVCFISTLPLWNQKGTIPGSQGRKRLTDYRTPLTETLRRPRVWLSAMLFFVYTGAEVVVGTWAYTLMTESRGIQLSTAGVWVGGYWAAFTVGRMTAGLYAKRAGVNRMVLGSLVASLPGALLLWLNPAESANLIALAWIGFAIAPIFASMTSGTSRRVGVPYATNTIGMQMAAASLGAAMIPSLVGILARRISLEVVPLCLLVLLAGLIGLYAAAMRGRVQDSGD